MRGIGESEMVPRPHQTPQHVEPQDFLAPTLFRLSVFAL